MLITIMSLVFLGLGFSILFHQFLMGKSSGKQKEEGQKTSPLTIVGVVCLVIGFIVFLIPS